MTDTLFEIVTEDYIEDLNKEWINNFFSKPFIWLNQEYLLPYKSLLAGVHLKTYKTLDNNDTYRIYVKGFQSENTETVARNNPQPGTGARTDLPLSKTEAGMRTPYPSPPASITNISSFTSRKMPCINRIIISPIRTSLA